MTTKPAPEQFGLFEIEETLRPPYSVPTMEEIRSRPRNGLVAVGSFSGSGGSSLGLKMAGWQVPVAIEFTPQGAATYRANHPEAFVFEQDVRTIEPEEILDALDLQLGYRIERGELDLFEGSPPCSSFSNAGVRAGGQFEDRVGKVKAYSEGIKQATDDLFDEWVRLVAGLLPKAIIAENVPEMGRPGSAQDYLFKIIGELSALGYDVHARVYSSLNAGCATMRKRLVLLGVRKDVGRAPIPTLLRPGYTVREALATLPVEIPEDEMRAAYFDGTGIDATTGEAIPAYAIGRHWHCIKPGEGHSPETCIAPNEDGSKPYLFSLIKADLDKPMYTVTATGADIGAASVVHPTEPRKFTPTELAWISGFPADYVLTGTPANRYERIGRAVTPPLYELLGAQLAKELGR